MSLPIINNYQFSIIARIFISHYQSFSIEKNGIKLCNIDSDFIKYIDILNMPILKKGIIWDSVVITLNGGGNQTIGGIDKLQSKSLFENLIQNKNISIKDFITQNIEKTNCAILEAKTIFNDNQYLRLADTLHNASNYIDKYQELLTVLQNPHIEKYYKKIPGYENIILILSNVSAYISQKNQFYIEQQLQQFKDFFDKIESNPLTDKQRLACVIDEQSNLVLAGAGTGKTSTMIGKVSYLMINKKANANEILMLAFGNEAAKEMQGRILTKLNNHLLKASTFHAMGKDIIAQVEGKQPKISDLLDDKHKLKLQKFIDNEIDSLLKDKQFSKNIRQYAINFYYPYESQFDFKKIEDYNQYLQNNNIRTLKGEQVKSLEECEIANFLYAQGIEYQYEKNYEVDTRDIEYAIYKPDFYLPTYKIYIEHFAVDENNNTPDFIEQEKYIKGMEWKRKTHQKHQTTLIETYSYFKKNGELTTKLSAILISAGVVFSPQKEEKMLENLKEFGMVSKISKLIANILSLFKSSYLTLSELSNQSNRRSQALLLVFKPIYNAYQKHLEQSNSIDYDDMIIRATYYIKTGKYKSPYRYVLIDEFQDISLARYKLVKALIDNKKNSSIFCVGDDWQAIYGFAGSDVNFTKKFNDYFPNSQTVFLDKTFRFNNKIGDFSAKFIQENPNQINKKISSHQQITTPAFSLLKTIDTNNAIEAALTDISSKKQNASVLILYRYISNIPENTNTLKKRYPKLTINYKTMHASKGLEADYVIIIELKGGVYGTPSKIISHPIIRLLQPKPEKLKYAEERRLFYVALTRAKHHVYLVANSSQPSDFVQEIIANNYEFNQLGNQFNDKLPDLCPKCNSGYLVFKNGKYGNFISCSNYPFCKHKPKICQKCNSIMGKHTMFYICKNNTCNHKQPICKKCGGIMNQKKGKYSNFNGCENYNTRYNDSCTYMQPI